MGPPSPSLCPRGPTRPAWRAPPILTHSHSRPVRRSLSCHPPTLAPRGPLSSGLCPGGRCEPGVGQRGVWAGVAPAPLSRWDTGALREQTRLQTCPVLAAGQRWAQGWILSRWATARLGHLPLLPWGPARRPGGAGEPSQSPSPTLCRSRGSSTHAQPAGEGRGSVASPSAQTARW